MATMVAYRRGMHARPGRSRSAIGHYWADRSRRCSTRAVATATSCPPTTRSTCGSTSSWPTTWPRSSASTRLADQPFDDSAQAAIATYLAGHQRNRHGALIYDLADFDLDAGSIRAGLSDYIDRFQIPLETLDTDQSHRRQLLDAVTDDVWEQARAGFGDDELATE